MTFTHLVQAGTYSGDHHRHYHININCSNVAGLQTQLHIPVLVDVSAPTGGVVMEGPVGREEVDFTSQRVLHVRWHGFADHESGVLMYRVVLAARCLTDGEMDAADNATEVTVGSSVTMTFPGTGWCRSCLSG